MDLEEFADPIFRLYRQYDKLVRRNLATPLRCKVDSTRLTTLLSNDDTLILKCFVCGSKIKPGLKEIDAVKKVVDEHFE